MKSHDEAAKCRACNGTRVLNAHNPHDPTETVECPDCPRATPNSSPRTEADTPINPECEHCECFADLLRAYGEDTSRLKAQLAAVTALNSHPEQRGAVLDGWGTNMLRDCLWRAVGPGRETREEAIADLPRATPDGCVDGCSLRRGHDGPHYGPDPSPPVSTPDGSAEQHRQYDRAIVRVWLDEVDVEVFNRNVADRQIDELLQRLASASPSKKGTDT